MSNLNFSSFFGRLKYSKLIRDWNQSQKRIIDPRIPHPSINYNLSATTSFEEYRRAFISDSCLRELPSLLAIANFCEDQDDFALFDYGCGLGRLGYAFSEIFGKVSHRKYIGYEIHPEAFEFLKNAYSGYQNFYFLTDRLLLEDSYVEIQQRRKDIKSSGASNKAIAARDVVVSSRLPSKVDVQFSLSVFTHMYPQAIIDILSDLRLCLKPGGVSVNSWLIVDRVAETSLKNGLADRHLPYEMQGFLTYSQTNPLICTAYRLDVMKDIYKKAGHKIVDILWGSWSNRISTQKFTYQDVVVSTPL